MFIEEQNISRYRKDVREFVPELVPGTLHNYGEFATIKSHSGLNSFSDLVPSDLVPGTVPKPA